mmetsp:Transcript_4993/g.16080  ORF Transcript_4993/g.16080 Transcript_4993/m.16080 type:complete len:110 (+) Transcript_4993:93-422(+)|eukprot:CAMPEP_0204594748 /NCGR_PEP_ID=MMETSP0661-20131031/52262_1 /ASSEMBLY_ACC=CAM_ASM_000606 /TAXON_ID=109239 /ORGANISM="Alexandrium margalefi, Strain AMGDE01CS-322" /LENGTH=109 /DNA_ID=CAMNT_0051605181 /DNA_START=84 /DNA_END=413 /DNA_ORIENTATION=+
MASFMFFGFLTALKQRYEDRVHPHDEGPRLRELWVDMEHKCFQKYLDEVDDDQRGVHVYEILKHEVSECKKIMVNDNRREVMQDCTSRVVRLYKRCADLGDYRALAARE